MLRNRMEKVFSSSRFNFFKLKFTVITMNSSPCSKASGMGNRYPSSSKNKNSDSSNYKPTHHRTSSSTTHRNVPHLARTPAMTVNF